MKHVKNICTKEIGRNFNTDETGRKIYTDETFGYLCNRQCQRIKKIYVQEIRHEPLLFRIQLYFHHTIVSNYFGILNIFKFTTNNPFNHTGRTSQALLNHVFSAPIGSQINHVFSVYQ